MNRPSLTFPTVASGNKKTIILLWIIDDNILRKFYEFLFLIEERIWRIPQVLRPTIYLYVISYKRCNEKIFLFYESTQIKWILCIGWTFSLLKKIMYVIYFYCELPLLPIFFLLRVKSFLMKPNCADTFFLWNVCSF